MQKGTSIPSIVAEVLDKEITPQPMLKDEIGAECIGRQSAEDEPNGTEAEARRGEAEDEPNEIEVDLDETEIDLDHLIQTKRGFKL